MEKNNTSIWVWFFMRVILPLYLIFGMISAAGFFLTLATVGLDKAVADVDYYFMVMMFAPLAIVVSVFVFICVLLIAAPMIARFRNKDA